MTISAATLLACSFAACSAPDSVSVSPYAERGAIEHARTGTSYDTNTQGIGFSLTWSLGSLARAVERDRRDRRPVPPKPEDDEAVNKDVIAAALAGGALLVWGYIKRDMLAFFVGRKAKDHTDDGAE